jgi:TolB-like protein
MGYGFEAYFLDPERRELRRGADLVPLEPQVFDLLQYLIENRDRVVSKDDLIAGVWNGRIVSDSALSSRITAARHAIGDSGEAQRLIRTVPRKGLRFVGEVRDDKSLPQAPSAASSAALTLALPDKPSIVVLPFANLSDDPAQDYFADGMVEDITIALGRLPWLFVIGSIAALSYKNRRVEGRQVSADLGVRYVLRGSVRKEGARVRITAELSDATTGGHIWADRFDGELDSVFEMQDRVAAQVSIAIAPALQSEEMRRARRKPTENLTAYDLFLRALQHHTVSFAHNQESLRLLYRAIELDPSYSAAYGLAAWCHFCQKMWGWVAPTDPRLEEGVRLAHIAAAIGNNDSEALWMAAQTMTLIAGELERAITLVERSLTLNPNSPNAWYANGMAHTFRDGAKADAGIEYHLRAWRLNPVDPWAYYYLAGVAFGQFYAGRYEDAAIAADRPLSREPTYAPMLRLKAATFGLLGRKGEAEEYARRLLAVNPAASVRTIRAYLQAPLQLNPAGLDAFVKGLRLAGLPEG